MMGMKNGGHVVLHGVVQDTEEDVQPGRPDEKETARRPRPMSLTRGVNIHRISPMKEKASGNTTDMADAVSYMKKQQGKRMGGREVT
jgi:hypothetical protein